jgi:hypothetical protein
MRMEVQMNRDISALIDRIVELPPRWHNAGSVSRKVLCAIAQYAEQLGPIKHSAETGSGRTTLLFSHLSAHHLVFARDIGRSVSQAKKSPLVNAQNVTFVEGPTQITLPNYSFTHKIQMALIDGPHGYPFPDLEYYYFYPLIETGGLLLVDDIHIPSIGRMFDVIKADDMFNLLEIVGHLAIFERSEAPLIDPHSDSWWLQGYNRAHFEKANGQKSSLVRSLAEVTPKPLKRMVPDGVKKMLGRVL